MNARLLTSVLCLAPLAAFAPSVRAQESRVPDANQRALALQRVAERTRADADLEIVTGTRAQLPLTGRAATAFKVIDRQSGEMHGVAFDDDGADVDMEAWIQAEIDARRARFGRLEPRLFERLATSGPDERIGVLLWARESTPSRVQRLLPEEGEAILRDEPARQAYRTAVDAERDEEVRVAIEPVRQRCRAAGLDAQPIGGSPVLFAEMTAAEIRAAARWDEIDTLYLDQQDVSMLESVRGTVRATLVESYRGWNGQSVPIAQIEVGGHVAPANPYLQGITQDWTFVCPTPDAHSTAVAGFIRSRHTTVRGMAPNVNLIATGSCNGMTSLMQNRATFAVNSGARILNLSFGSAEAPVYPYGNARFYDDLALNRACTVVAAAGNGGTTGNPRVVEPANGFNGLAVGAFNDSNDSSWAYDYMANFSSWHDPASWYGDREEPDVAAPGDNVESTSVAPPYLSNVGSGTSYATPVVSGIAALLMHRRPTLDFWPEAVRAIIMASAVHNVEGASRLSERDGAGGVDALNADNIAGSLGGGWGGISYSCSSPSPLTTTSMLLAAGRRTRVAIAYDTETSSANPDYSGGPSADLDLQVLSPGGSVVAYSASYDNTFEIVDFVAPYTGTYQVRVSRYRCNQSPRYLGYAWMQE